MLRQITNKTFIGLAFCFVGAGCSTPKTALDLAKVTSTNASLIETKIVNFNKSSEEIYKGRTEAAEKQSQAIERSRTEIDAYLEAATSAATISGASKNPHYGTVVVELQRVSAAIQARQAAALAKRGEFRAATLAEYIKLDKPPTELSIIAANLSSLAEDLSDEDRLKSLQNFYKAILDGLKEKAGPDPAAGAGATAK
jgi:triphosphoribosyl-dephospho-CoA synthetase